MCRRCPEVCVVRQNPLNKLSDQVRHQVAEAGFTEALTFSLVRPSGLPSRLCSGVASSWSESHRYALRPTLHCPFRSLSCGN